MTESAAFLGFSTMTVDIDEKTAPDICVDVLDWDFKAAGLGHFDFIHASPPCEELSKCKSNGTRDLERAYKIATRMREILDYFRKQNPRMQSTIENPSSSLLCKHDSVAGFGVHECCYCAYGYPYQKPTKIWTTLSNLQLQTCTPIFCFWGGEGNHPLSVQNVPKPMRKKIPQCLCLRILYAVCEALNCLQPPRVQIRPQIRVKRVAPTLPLEEKVCQGCGATTTRYGKWYGARSVPRILMCGRCYQRTQKQSKRRTRSKP